MKIRRRPDRDTRLAMYITFAQMVYDALRQTETSIRLLFENDAHHTWDVKMPAIAKMHQHLGFLIGQASMSAFRACQC